MPLIFCQPYVDSIVMREFNSSAEYFTISAKNNGTAIQYGAIHATSDTIRLSASNPGMPTAYGIIHATAASFSTKASR